MGNLLILGGSGFVSRYVADEALARGYDVFCVTRGNRDTVTGVHMLTADRNDPEALTAALRSTGCRFDGVIDCICFSAEQAREDIRILPEFTDRLIVLSTDSLYHPAHKRVPQDENADVYMEDDSYGGKKRQMEHIFLTECPDSLRWTLFRPPHMFGAGSELGCFPTHTRQKDLLAHLRAGKPIRLVGGGEYRIQPLYAGDMAKAAVAAVTNANAENEIFCIAGPEAMPNRRYFEILASLLGVTVLWEDLPVSQWQAASTDGYLYLCDRVYDLSKLKNAGLPVPSVTLAEGLKEQIDWLTALGR